VIVARAFFRRGLQEALSYRAAFVMQLFTGALSLASFFFLASFIDLGRSPLLAQYGGDYLSFGLVGMVLLNLQFTAVSVYPTTIRQAQVAGTLEAMLATPTPAWLVLVCAPLYRFSTAFFWGVLLIVAGGLFFGLRFDNANAASIALTLPLCVLAFASLGFFGAAATMVLRRPDPISYVLGAVSTLVGGVFYPTQILPAWLQSAGKALPITHALELVRRATFANASIEELGAPLVGLALFCVVSVPLGLAAFAWSIRRARRDGSLTHF